jgi:lipid II:glycine glycyltransferase (peptidoglycan interpeptide bridge formation enzyme)
MFELRREMDKKQWNTFVENHPEGTFLQSWEWGILQEHLGNQVTRCSIQENGNIIALMAMYTIHARRGSYIFIPYGPILPQGSKRKECWRYLKDELIKRAKDEHVWFIKCSPYWDKTSENINYLSNSDFRPSPMHSKAETTWILDIRQSLSEILQGMKKDHRYLIRQGEKIGIRTENLNSKEGVNLLYLMQKETAKRHAFMPFPELLWQKQFACFSAIDRCFIKFAWYEDEPIAGAFIMLSGKCAYYHYGASSKTHPKLPASHVLLWDCLRETKERGYELFNFWGTAPLDPLTGKVAKNHPFSGITHFKVGFGGRVKELVPCHDLPMSKKYWLTFLFEYVRKKMKNF